MLVEILDGSVLARGKEVLAHIADGTLDAPLLVRAIRRARSRLEAVVAGEREHCWVEAHRVSLALEHGAL
ncbi:hypothetical protein WME91_08735 [Sorangium sp. So ce269]